MKISLADNTASTTSMLEDPRGRTSHFVFVRGKRGPSSTPPKDDASSSFKIATTADEDSSRPLRANTLKPPSIG